MHWVGGNSVLWTFRTPVTLTPPAVPALLYYSLGAGDDVEPASVSQISAQEILATYGDAEDGKHWSIADGTYGVAEDTPIAVPQSGTEA